MKTLLVSLRIYLLLTLLTGLAYPFLVTIGAKLLAPSKADGSLIYSEDGKLLGSALIGQAFKEERYIWGRPSAVDYNPLPSGGSNLGPTSKALQEKWSERRKLGFNDEMLAASASGLDPHISPDAAYGQLPRIARARGKTEGELKEIVAKLIEERELGFLGEPRVNVLKLNLLLDQRIR